MVRDLFIFFLLSALFGIVPAAAQTKMPEFSATLVVLEKGNTVNGRFYFTENKQRLEMASSDSDDRSIIITRLDKEVAWMLMPSKKMYMEVPIEQKEPNPLAEDPEKIIKRERIGKDTVDGHPCLKEKITIKNDDGSQEQMYWWQATDLGWPVQAEALDGSWRYTYKDIKMCRQDPSLFEVPKGYERMTTPSFNAPEPDYPEAPDAPEPEYPEPYYPDYPEPPVPSPPLPW